MEKPKGPHFYKSFLLSALSSGCNDKKGLVNDDPERKGDLFYHNVRKLAYGQLLLNNMIEEKDGKAYLTKLGKKYRKKGFQAYLDRKNKKKRRKAWWARNNDNRMLVKSFLLGIMGTIIAGIILYKLGYI